MSKITENAQRYWESDPLMDDDGGKGFEAGARWALDTVRELLSGEDTVEWARTARESAINLAYAMELIDGLEMEDD